jgi:predicted phage terminase large subunit-like protein
MTAAVQEPAGFTAESIRQELNRRANAKRRLIDFAKYVDPNYIAFPVHHYIAEKLEKVERGETRRLAIFVGPSTGKSRLASEIFPAWVQGRNKNFELIACSYNADKAEEFGATARNLIKEPAYGRLFPEVTLAEDSRAQGYWKTSAGGTYKAEGVDGGLVGFHAHIAIIDDPVKNVEEAFSDRRRSGIQNWYSAVLLNRLRSYKGGPGSVILIMQRWHDDDLGGYVLKKMQDGEEHWDIVMLPSLAEADDPLGRAEGEPLLPDGPNQRTREELYVLKRDNPEHFMALHQQKPLSESGEIFKREWFQTYHNLPQNLTFYAASDYATGEHIGDYTVHVVVGVDQNGYIYVVDVWRDRKSSLEWVDAVLRLAVRWSVLMWGEERGQIIKGVGPFLAVKMQEEGVYFLRRGMSSTGNKVLRARSIAGMVQSKRVFLPERADWLSDFLYELTHFPSTKHDDQVDAFSLLGRMLTSLRATRVEQPPEERPEKIVTFNDLVARRGRQRRGIRAGGPMISESSTPHFDDVMKAVAAN